MSIKELFHPLLKRSFPWPKTNQILKKTAKVSENQANTQRKKIQINSPYNPNPEDIEAINKLMQESSDKELERIFDNWSGG
ncbi:MAG: hypothetical protein QNJ31_03465 [Candidatus Caenarcaniphilales bacterium]|nr:hypothetical protein [Candidatus Caenarcaniphilales bacterium]